jgi:NADH-quinone oxidoreductase subunit J
VSYPLFFVLAALIIAFASGVVVTRHPVRSAMCLVVTLFLLAVLFVFLDADFVAALQVVVYAGAILVVFLFVIMLLNLQDDAAQTRMPRWASAAVVAAGLFAVAVLSLLKQTGDLLPGPGMGSAPPAEFGSIQAVGLTLFTRYLLPFEITGLLMLAGVIGAVVLAKRKL